jgi:hypothetical protein
MKEIENYRDEIELIFAEVSEGIDGFPPGLSGIGHVLLERSHPLRSGGGKNAISYLLPYWFREQFGSPIGLCRDLAVGNIYGMLHFFLLDDAMDRGSGQLEDIRGSLALGQLLHSLFQQRYNRCFPYDSPLWEYYRKYLGEWASAVYSEPVNPINPSDPGQLARKAAPIKICAAGLLLQSGSPDGIPDAEEAVDLALAVLQLSDDRADWQDDLAAEPNCNAFLSLVREKLSVPAGTLLDERSVKRAIYHHQCLDRLAEIAEDYVERLGRIISAPQRLMAFQSTIAQGIRKDAKSVENSIRRLAAGGGFSNFLSNFEK